MPRHAPPYARPTLLAIAIAALAACGITDPNDDERDRLNAARSRWQEQNITSYSFRLTDQCTGCPDAFRRPFIVEVEDGTITDVRDAQTGDPPPNGYQARTIPQFFDLIRGAIDDRADILIVNYHSELGYPTLISIDVRFQVPEDEYGYRITQLQPRE